MLATSNFSSIKSTMPDQTFACNYRCVPPIESNYDDSLVALPKSAPNQPNPGSYSRLLDVFGIIPRGRRAGKDVKKREIQQRNAIKTILTHHEHESSSRLRGVNTDNLIQIKRHNLPVSKVKSLSMAVINCRSLNKNGIKLKDHIVEYDCDIVAVTETWLPCEDILANHIIGDVCPKGYKMSHTPRSSGHRGGGVGLIYKTSLDIRVPTTNEPPTMPKYKSFEYSHHLLKINSKWVRIVNIYRPPPSITNGLTTEKFFSEFEMFMEYVTTLPGQILILGDVNYHLEDTSNGQTRDFLELLDILNLSQLVNQPTHRLGHTLDCIITEKNSNLVNNIQVYTPWISDHCLVAFNVSVQIPALCHKSITTRNWKSLNLDQLNSDIMDADFGNSSNSVSECVHHYDHTLHNLIDIHAPARNKTILPRPRAPWFTYDLSLEKRKKRRLERRYRNTGTTEDALLFKEQSARYCQLLSTSRETFYNSKIVENAGDQKALFSVVNKLLHRKSETQLPAYDNQNELTNRFANFFINKIRNIRCELGDALPYKESEISTATSCELTVFSAVTTSDIQSLINKSNNKCCSLDPIPTWLFKNCLPSLLPIVTNIVNQSLESIMPSSYKEAVLTPILKKPNMDPEVLKNYRPVSNLPYVSKLIEKIVDLQSLTIGDEVVGMNKSIRLLGVDFDDNISLKQHVNSVARKCFYTIKNMFRIRRCLDESSAKTMVCTMITSHLDYCNVILCGLPDSTLKHLTRIQRMSARFVSQRAKYDHITPTMKQLHWLPIRHRIHYKVLLLTYKSMNGLAPSYLEDLIKKRPMKRTRADGNNDLSVPRIKKTTFGGRSFAYTGATLWNSLPRELKLCSNLNQFKKDLKTYLFTKAYGL